MADLQNQFQSHCGGRGDCGGHGGCGNGSDGCDGCGLSNSHNSSGSVPTAGPHSELQPTMKLNSIAFIGTKDGKSRHKCIKMPQLEHCQGYLDLGPLQMYGHNFPGPTSLSASHDGRTQGTNCRTKASSDQVGEAHHHWPTCPSPTCSCEASSQPQLPHRFKPNLASFIGHLGTPTVSRNHL